MNRTVLDWTVFHSNNPLIECVNSTHSKRSIDFWFSFLIRFSSEFLISKKKNEKLKTEKQQKKRERETSPHEMCLLCCVHGVWWFWCANLSLCVLYSFSQPLNKATTIFLCIKLFFFSHFVVAFNLETFYCIFSSQFEWHFFSSFFISFTSLSLPVPLEFAFCSILFSFPCKDGCLRRMSIGHCKYRAKVFTFIFILW